MKKATKKTGLGNFMKPAAPAASESAEPPARTRGEGATVAITIRLPAEQWERLHALAISRRTSLQGLAIEGFSAMFKKDGQTPIVIKYVRRYRRKATIAS